MELQHFLHEHPLYLNHYVAYASIRGKIFRCQGCGEDILDLGYSCKMCEFFLHKSCGEQPRELQQHPLHPQHPLILTPTIPHPLKRCYFCNKYIVVGYSYNCSHRNFNLHLKCASIPFTLKPEFHDHALKLLRKSLSFTCDACGIKDEHMYSYACTSLTCSLMVHRKCAALPLTLKHTSHHHALKLTNSSELQVDQSHRRFCHLCVRKVHTNKVYHCSKCNFVAHLDCATREGDTDETFMLEFKDKQPLESTGTLKNEDLELDESIDSLPYVVKKMKIGEDRIEIAEEIKHVSHEHDLKLTEELLNSKKCNGCMHPIFPHPFYSCAQCRFFLHKSCVELPRKKRHPLHPHLLTLFTEPPYNSGVFYCNLCGRDCDRFTYNCEKCEFDADVQCSLISDIFTHDVHEHPLILSKAPYNEKCSCCDYKGKVFKCIDCEFTLDLRCATLPRRVRYRYFEQPFKLCYNAEDDSDDNDYYCDICEEKRNPKYGFYYCEDLNFYAHPKCILGKSPYMKRWASTTSL
ncbi:uncharacterized protein LOC132168942 [Corylus avellana]|uniref:uncharacterized protein LOC132168942 n=1 Tax=Corylus avellana TaxID=13451 RepID=UPI00286A9474|nr:uncharacterized protein LOC132168942 [Corylus avellana]